MERIELDLQTGELKTIPLTPGEIEDAQLRTAAEAIDRENTPTQAQSLVADIMADKKALAALKAALG